MNRNDLDDILSYDTDAAVFFGIGTFSLSGSWIVLEQWLSPDGPIYGPLFWVCASAIPFGLFMLWQGWRQHAKKRGRIERIFRETHDYQPAETPNPAIGRNVTTPRAATRASQLPKDSATGTTR